VPVRAERSDFPLWFCLRGNGGKSASAIFVFWLPNFGPARFLAAAMRLRPAAEIVDFLRALTGFALPPGEDFSEGG